MCYVVIIDSVVGAAWSAFACGCIVDDGIAGVGGGGDDDVLI
jgi:hypothetical protein